MSDPDDPGLGRPVLGGARSMGPLNGGTRSARHGGLTGPPRGIVVAERDKGARSKVKPKAKGGGAAAGREITVIGTFKNPFGSAADEVTAMKEKRWSPSSDDFAAVADNSMKISEFTQLLAVVLVSGNSETKNGSIRRINIFTHANSDLLAMSGTITSSGMSVQVGLRVSGALSVDVLDNLNKPGVTFNVAAQSKAISSKKFSLDDVRKRFTKDAVIAIYACHSAMDGRFVQQIADTFQVKVRGFSDVIGYYPSYDEGPRPSVKNRRRVGIGYNSKVVESDFHNLDANSNAIEKSPTAPAVKAPSNTDDDDE